MTQQKILDGQCFIESYSGRALFPLAMRAADVDIEDIAHALSNKCRFTGHCSKFYSVAQHSVLVSELAPRDLALAGLLHDAAEYVLPDVSTPVKKRLAAFKEIEESALDAIFKHFGILGVRDDEYAMSLIKDADRQALAIEAENLMPNKPEHWGSWDLPPVDPYHQFRALSPEASKSAFLARYRFILETTPQ